MAAPFSPLSSRRRRCHSRHSRRPFRGCISCRGIYQCTTYITLLTTTYYSPVTDAFSLVQNAAATSSTSQQQSSSTSDASVQVVGGAGTANTAAASSASGRSSSSSLHHHAPFSATAAASSLNNNNNPFRGALSTTASSRRRHHNHGNRRQYQPHPSSLAGGGEQQVSSSTSSVTDDFALRMGMIAEQWDDEQQHYCNDPSSSTLSPCSSDNESMPSMSIATDRDEEKLYERRAFLHGMLSTTAAVATVASTTTTTIGSTSLISPWSPEPANAYEQSYPLELQMTPIGEVENSSNSLTKLNEERMSYKKAKVKATQLELKNDPLGSSSWTSIHDLEVTIAGAFTWGWALWLALGSRSNPIVTPLANVLYGGNANVDGDDEKDENINNQSNDNGNISNTNNCKSDNQWLKDRNDGFFGELPPTFMAILSVVFVVFGIVLDRAVYFLADGDADVSLQLAGVSVIGGAVWEVGRLATKEKAPTRDEYDRDVEIYREFQEFAEKRIIVGGRSNSGGRSSSTCSCHRSDVISAFRRYNPKYRTAENEQFPLSDIEIERILRKWNRELGSGSEMSSAGFFSGICVDGVADAFAPR